MVNVHDELKRAQDAFYSSMFDGDEEIEMLQAYMLLVIMNQWTGITCPEYPGF